MLDVGDDAKDERAGLVCRERDGIESAVDAENEMGLSRIGTKLGHGVEIIEES